MDILINGFNKDKDIINLDQYTGCCLECAVRRNTFKLGSASNSIIKIYLMTINYKLQAENEIAPV